MSRLVASEHGLRALVAISQRPEGLRPAEVAAILEVPFSSAERALNVLEEDGLVEHRDRRFALVTDARAGAAVRFALAMVEPVEALATLARANRAAEFAGTDDQGAVLVIRRFAEPADEALLHAALADLGALHGELQVELLDKSALRERLLDDRSPRDRALGCACSPGPSTARSPTGRDMAMTTLRSCGGSTTASRPRATGACMPSPVATACVAWWRSAPPPGPTSGRTRTWTSSWSQPPAQFGLRQRAALNADAETLFARDVDLVAAGEVRPALAARIAREGVALHGPAA